METDGKTRLYAYYSLGRRATVHDPSSPDKPLRTDEAVDVLNRQDVLLVHHRNLPNKKDWYTIDRKNANSAKLKVRDVIAVPYDCSIQQISSILTKAIEQRSGKRGLTVLFTPPVF